MLTPREEAAYWAGIIDGEGQIAINKNSYRKTRSPTFTLYLRVSCGREFIPNSTERQCLQCRIVKCHYCGTEFIPEMDGRRREFKHRFCSRECFFAWHKK